MISWLSWQENVISSVTSFPPGFLFSTANPSPWVRYPLYAQLVAMMAVGTRKRGVQYWTGSFPFLWEEGMPLRTLSDGAGRLLVCLSMGLWCLIVREAAGANGD